MLFKKLVEYSNRLKKVSLRNAKIDVIIDFLGRLNSREAEIGVDYIAGKIKQGRLNIAWKGLSQLLKTPASRVQKSPQLIEVDGYLGKVQSARGREKLKVI
jgi:DNA ligase-1